MLELPGKNAVENFRIWLFNLYVLQKEITESALREASAVALAAEEEGEKIWTG